jgi:hypothetical protein
MEIDRRSGRRGSGPAPPGYVKCLARPWASCPFSRDFSTGRFTAVGTHYHPLVPGKEDRMCACVHRFREHSKNEQGEDACTHYQCGCPKFRSEGRSEEE